MVLVFFVGILNIVNESVVEIFKLYMFFKVISNVKDVLKFGLVYEVLGLYLWEGLDYCDEGDRLLIVML